jgi:UDP-GlcNAc3NAcA epimerase
MKIATIVGARPQFIKAAAVSRAITAEAQMTEVMIHTGQHFDDSMSDIFFKEMAIPKPKYNLSINQMSHGSMTGRMLEKIEEILMQEKPSAVLVYGDTNSTLAGALAGAKLHIPIAHVEAGLRSFNMHMPEEINRVLTDRISSILFCPTDQAVKNLKTEGYEQLGARICNVGDVMYDAAVYYAQFSKDRCNIKIPTADFVLVTIHRAENTDNIERLKGLVGALNSISEHVDIFLPLHPRTKKILENLGFKFAFKTHPPVGYFEMLELLKNCKMVLTDSGGLQKEAYFFNKYCLTLRDETEWTELVETDSNSLVSSDQNKILNQFFNQINKQHAFVPGLYGDAHASEKIVLGLKSLLK